ncbi:MAG: hypothetical protein OXU20_24460 [Myxococcales bacterium]|nr:hypothetical protein [Myxococcales bacterium]
MPEAGSPPSFSPAASHAATVTRSSIWQPGLAVAVASAIGWLLLCAWVAPHVPLNPVGAYAWAFASVSAASLAVAYHTPPTSSVRSLGLSVLAAAACLTWLHLSGAGGLWGAAGVMGGLLLLGVAVGTFVGARVERPGHLLFVALVSSLADIVSVYHPQGVSHAIIESETALSLLALSFPMLGTDAIEPLLGVGDLVFVALYLTASRVHQLSLRRTLAALSLGLAVTAASVVVLEMALPALPFLGLSILIALPAARGA